MIERRAPLPAAQPLAQMAARIAALLDGDASERAVAYAQLTALSHRQPCEEVDAHLAGSGRPRFRTATAPSR